MRSAGQPTQIQARELVQIQQNAQPKRVQQIQQQFSQQPQQTTAIKPTTASQKIEDQQIHISNLMRGSFSHRINSHSVATRTSEVPANNAQATQQPHPQSASSSNRSYSSMISLGLKNNLVGAAKKLEEAAEQQQRTLRNA